MGAFSFPVDNFYNPFPRGRGCLWGSAGYGLGSHDGDQGGRYGDQVSLYWSASGLGSHAALLLRQDLMASC
jgi:hypothetical protein